MTEQARTRSFRIPDEDWAVVVEHCESRGITPTQFLHEAIAEALGKTSISSVLVDQDAVDSLNQLPDLVEQLKRKLRK